MSVPHLPSPHTNKKKSGLIGEKTKEQKEKKERVPKTEEKGKDGNKKVRRKKNKNKIKSR